MRHAWNIEDNHNPGNHYPLFLFSTVIGVCGKDGVVLGIEKLISSKLHEISSNRRLFTVDKHVGIVSIELVVTSSTSSICEVSLLSRSSRVSIHLGINLFKL